MTKKKTGGLGSGLEWIGSTPQKVEEVLPVEEVACSLVEAVAPAVQTNQVSNVNEMPSASSYEELLSRYEYHAQQLQALQLPVLEARLSKSLAETAALEKQAPKKAKKVASCQRGLPEGWARITVIMREENIDRLKQCSHDHDTTVKDLVDLALFKLFKTT